MSIEKLLEGLDEAKANEIRAAIETNYVGRNIAHEDKDIQSRIVGKTLGTFETKLKRNLKSVDEGLMTPQEIDELGFDKALDAAFERVAERQKTLSNQIKTSSKPDSELKKQFEETRAKLETISTDYGQVVQQKQTLEEQLAQKDSEFNSYKTNLFIDSKKRDALSKITFTDSLPDALKTIAVDGFMNAINSKYDLQPSDEDASGLRIVDKTTGQRVAKDNNFLSLDEIYREEAHKVGLLKISNGNGNTDSKEKKTIFESNRPKETTTNSLGLKIKS